MAIYNTEEERINALKLAIETKNPGDRIPMADIAREGEVSRDMIDFLAIELSNQIKYDNNSDTYSTKSDDVWRWVFEEDREEPISEEIMEYALDELYKVIVRSEDGYQGKAADLAKATLFSIISQLSNDDSKKRAINKFKKLERLDSLYTSPKLAGKFEEESNKCEYLSNMIQEKYINTEEIDKSIDLRDLITLVRSISDNETKKKLLDSLPNKMKLSLLPYVDLPDEEKQKHLEKILSFAQDRLDSPEAVASALGYTGSLVSVINSLKDDRKKVEYISLFERRREAVTEEISKKPTFTSDQKAAMITRKNQEFIRNEFEMIYNIRNTGYMEEVHNQLFSIIPSYALYTYFGLDNYFDGNKDVEMKKIAQSTLRDFAEQMNARNVREEEERKTKEEAAKLATETRNQTYTGNEASKPEVKPKEPTVDEIIADMKKKIPMTLEQEQSLRTRILDKRRQQYEDDKELRIARSKAIEESTRMAAERNRAISAEVEDRQYETDKEIFTQGVKDRTDVEQGKELEEAIAVFEGYGIPLTEEQLKQVREAKINKEYYEFRYNRVPEIDARRRKEIINPEYFGMDPALSEEMAEFYEKEGGERTPRRL